MLNELFEQIAAISHDRLFVLTDENTRAACWDVVKGHGSMAGAEVITIGAGDEAKTVESLCHVWGELGRLGGSRRSLMVNLGGGMVTDLGGFAASTFKRGIAFVNVPTTLLAMVDASVGGKTGVNFGGLKNEVGVFNEARAVVLDTVFLRTLDAANLRSGYAEMLKHGLISTREHLADVLRVDLGDATCLDMLTPLVEASVEVKRRIVAEDPREKGIRKALNLGHTVGHALESLAMRKGRGVLHGYAVAWGLVCELYLSVLRCGFPIETMRQVVQVVRETYGQCEFTCKDYDEIYELMTHDKKNHDGEILCTLLGGVGDVRVDEAIGRAEVEEMLEFLREG